MNVIITGPDLFDKGGVANYYSTILPTLSKDDELNINYIEVGSTKKSIQYIHPIADQIRFFIQMKKYSPSLVHINPSLVYKSYIRDGLFVYQAKLLSLPVVVFFRGWNKSFESKLDNNKNLQVFFRKTYLRADAFIVLASEFKKKLEDWGVTVPIHLRTTVVPESLIKNFSIEKKIESLNKDKSWKILFLARIEKEKGIFETLDALRILLERGFNVTLTIAGDGEALSSVIMYLKEYKLFQDKVNVVGYARGAKKEEILTSHHVYCFPTYGEGMPNSVLEAMAFGMPVITCPVGGIKDFFQDKEMGYLLYNRNSLELANLLQKIISDKSGALKIAQHNYSYAKEHFGEEIIVKELKQIYKTFN